MEVDRAAG
uniref:Uncharacterized protein n=1 Tax=Arundo donax TaxID=35708 RepID=A0A0A9BA00_ARUDO